MNKTPGQANSKELLEAINQSVLSKKAHDLVNLELKYLDNSITDYFVICHADSDVHVHAIADEVLKQVRETLNENVFRKEGYQNAHWILLDYVDVVVHVFQTAYREFYNLESLWADAPQKSITTEEPKEE